MARYKGIFKTSNNYEPQVAGPFDARMLVQLKSDLTAKATWAQTDGSVWTYAGMIVAVAADTPENNGVYMLLAKDYSLEENWRKLADDDELRELIEKVENIEVASGADVEVGSIDQLPSTGTSGVTYFVRNTQTIYRWDADLGDYISYGGGSADLDNIQMIYGGDSNV